MKLEFFSVNFLCLQLLQISWYNQLKYIARGGIGINSRAHRSIIGGKGQILIYSFSQTVKTIDFKNCLGRIQIHEYCIAPPPLNYRSLGNSGN